MSRFSEILANHQRLQDRITYSKDLLDRIRARLDGHTSCNKPELCIFAAGSLARHETGRVSDLDLFFIGNRSGRKLGDRSISRLEEIEAFAELIRLNDELGLQRFSGDGLYLKVHECWRRPKTEPLMRVVPTQN